MPFVEHNEPWIPGTVKREVDLTRNLLRRLRHIVEQGHIIEPPLAIITELGRHASLLSHAINQFTIRHDYLESTDKIHHSEHEGVVTFVDCEARREPSVLITPVCNVKGKDEFEIYQDLGFSEREYKDLLLWEKAWQERDFDLKGAFDLFTTEVVSDLQGGRYSIKIEDIVPGMAGIVGIALDVVFFAPTAAVPPLVSSCATGIAAIAAKFPEVQRKLFGRGRRKGGAQKLISGTRHQA
jgi:hypothetical protein